ncbi:hypothetical protein [uncultured Roseobacter sp.]|uniref:hypothetical protein n=1 Tax=uncultured Roseobacter sp. TaxID=114847 RepID=UPI002639392D|nr:hypothetical protein [uncultured Roseobacter sp.]
MTDRRAVCIIERNPFVAEDMREMLCIQLPDADLSVFYDMADARSGTAKAPDLIMIAADAHGSLDLSQDDLLWINGTKIIAFDTRNRDAHKDWIYLSKPFSEQELIGSVRAALSEKAHEARSDLTDI